jgi:hypothetical protein
MPDLQYSPRDSTHTTNFLEIAAFKFASFFKFSAYDIGSTFIEIFASAAEDKI